MAQFSIIIIHMIIIQIWRYPIHSTDCSRNTFPRMVHNHCSYSTSFRNGPLHRWLMELLWFRIDFRLRTLAARLHTWYSWSTSSQQFIAIHRHSTTAAAPFGEVTRVRPVEHFQRLTLVAWLQMIFRRRKFNASHQTPPFVGNVVTLTGTRVVKMGDHHPLGHSRDQNGQHC